MAMPKALTLLLRHFAPLGAAWRAATVIAPELVINNNLKPELSKSQIGNARLDA
jgi:hypothetical protein